MNDKVWKMRSQESRCGISTAVEFTTFSNRIHIGIGQPLAQVALTGLCAGSVVQLWPGHPVVFEFLKCSRHFPRNSGINYA